MLGYIGELFRLGWAIYFLAGTALLIYVVVQAKGRTYKIGAAVVVITMVGFFPAKITIEENQKKAALVERNRAMNAQFEKRCKEDARVTIKRVVENVDGIFIMKPRAVAKSKVKAKLKS